MQKKQNKKDNGEREGGGVSHNKVGTSDWSREFDLCVALTIHICDWLLAENCKSSEAC